jgi:hypothetical protein
MYVLPQDITMDSVHFCIQNKEYDLLMLTHFVYCWAGIMLLLRSNINMNCIISGHVVSNTTVYVLLDVIFLDQKYYMFRPVVAIIRFYRSAHLRLFYKIRVAARHN